ncbi:MAG: hypothetical protein U1E97_11005 [Alphaproteobacteria bacterium]
MQAIKPDITAANVKVTYTNSGLGNMQSRRDQAIRHSQRDGVAARLHGAFGFSRPADFSITLPAFASTGVSNPVN